jgi:AI-2 transport protein TqsA
VKKFWLDAQKLKKIDSRMTESPKLKFANTEIRVQTAGIAVLATIAIGATIKWLGPVLVPFILAVFFVCGIAPIIDFFQNRLRVSRLIAAAITFLLGLGLLLLFWLLIWISIASLIGEAPRYRSRLTELVERGSQMIPVDRFEFLEKNKRIQRPPPGDQQIDQPSETEPGKTDDAKAIDVPVSDSPSQVSPEEAGTVDLASQSSKFFMYFVQYISEGIPSLLGSAVMMMIFMFFLLLGDAQIGLEKPTIWLEIEGKIRSYIVTKTVISALTGVAVGFALWMFDIPLAFVFGMLACLLNFIPNVGPLLMCVLPLPLIVLDPDLSMPSMITVILLVSAIEFVSGNVVETKVMGDSFELHPVVVLLTLMLWGMIWDLPGMFLATPITAAMKILLEKFEYTRPVAEMMAGRFDSLANMGQDLGPISQEESVS